MPSKIRQASPRGTTHQKVEVVANHQHDGEMGGLEQQSHGHFPNNLHAWLMHLPTDFFSSDAGIVCELKVMINKLFQHLRTVPEDGAADQDSQSIQNLHDGFKNFWMGKSELESQLPLAPHLNSQIVVNLAALLLILYQGKMLSVHGLTPLTYKIGLTLLPTEVQQGLKDQVPGLLERVSLLALSHFDWSEECPRPNSITDFIDLTSNAIWVRTNNLNRLSPIIDKQSSNDSGFKPKLVGTVTPNASYPSMPEWQRLRCEEACRRKPQQLCDNWNDRPTGAGIQPVLGSRSHNIDCRQQPPGDSVLETTASTLEGGSSQCNAEGPSGRNFDLREEPFFVDCEPVQNQATVSSASTTELSFSWGHKPDDGNRRLDRMTSVSSLSDEPPVWKHRCEGFLASLRSKKCGFCGKVSDNIVDNM